jgi:hypothetical protein
MFILTLKMLHHERENDAFGLVILRHDIQPNDAQHNNIHYNGTQHNNIHHYNTKHNNKKTRHLA